MILLLVESRPGPHPLVWQVGDTSKLVDMVKKFHEDYFVSHASSWADSIRRRFSSIKHGWEEVGYWLSEPFSGYSWIPQHWLLQHRRVLHLHRDLWLPVLCASLKQTPVSVFWLRDWPLHFVPAGISVSRFPTSISRDGKAEADRRLGLLLPMMRFGNLLWLCVELPPTKM